MIKRTSTFLALSLLNLTPLSAQSLSDIVKENPSPEYIRNIKRWQKVQQQDLYLLEARAAYVSKDYQKSCELMTKGIALLLKLDKNKPSDRLSAFTHQLELSTIAHVKTLELHGKTKIIPKYLSEYVFYSPSPSVLLLSNNSLQKLRSDQVASYQISFYCNMYNGLYRINQGYTADRLLSTLKYTHPHLTAHLRIFSQNKKIMPSTQIPSSTSQLKNPPVENIPTPPDKIK